MKQQPQPVEAQTDYVPLRIRLFQDLALMMEDRVLKLSKADQKDQLWTVARDQKTGASRTNGGIHSSRRSSKPSRNM